MRWLACVLVSKNGLLARQNLRIDGGKLQCHGVCGRDVHGKLAAERGQLIGLAR